MQLPLALVVLLQLLVVILFFHQVPPMVAVMVDKLVSVQALAELVVQVAAVADLMLLREERQTKAIVVAQQDTEIMALVEQMAVLEIDMVAVAAEQGRQVLLEVRLEETGATVLHHLLQAHLLLTQVAVVVVQEQLAALAVLVAAVLVVTVVQLELLAQLILAAVAVVVVIILLAVKAGQVS